MSMSDEPPHGRVLAGAVPHSAHSDIPWDGLVEMLRGWSGRGALALYEALAVSAGTDDAHPYAWSARDVQRRAHRVVYEKVAPAVDELPTRRSVWLDALPAMTEKYTVLSDEIGPGVDWNRTRLTGWPPNAFYLRSRRRSVDPVPLGLAKWCIDKLRELHRDARALDRPLTEARRSQVQAAVDLLSEGDLGRLVALAPTTDRIQALRELGTPWTQLATLAQELERFFVTCSLVEFAREAIFPVSTLTWRLFHLAAFGEIVRSLRDAGAVATSVRPLSGSYTSGPSYAVVDDSGAHWDLWFESAGMWDYYGWTSPYNDLHMQAFSSPALMGADIALVGRPPTWKAILFECKWGDRDYVSRDGFHQATTYAAELHGIVEHIETVVVGRDSVVPTSSMVTLAQVPTRLVGTSHLPGLLQASLGL
ncbi:hypothetical protein [Actinomycetospora callitridis]|uniref:hypothetical protein n=1 Tax=Actinomycetospora callitridis TaxID=913944 RepID=UPI002366410C|nr:hypothetical protein [Actinomycetospora callitridis]MDD7919683.1 hypothetical protein [Actinomycetospora callitridis]